MEEITRSNGHTPSQSRGKLKNRSLYFFTGGQVVDPKDSACTHIVVMSEEDAAAAGLRHPSQVAVVKQDVIIHTWEPLIGYTLYIICSGSGKALLWQPALMSHFID